MTLKKPDVPTERPTPAQAKKMIARSLNAGMRKEAFRKKAIRMAASQRKGGR